MDSVICYLPTVDDVREGLGRLWTALRPGGVLVLDNHNFLHHAGADGEPTEGEVVGEDIRTSYVQRQWYDDFSSVFHVELDAQVEEEGEVWEVSSEEVLRVMTAAELSYYLEDAGFENVSVFPGYDMAPPTQPASDRMIFLAHKSPDAPEFPE
jgi:hypothetical protein